MKTVDVYRQDFAAHCQQNGRERRAVRVTLTATSEAGTVRYEAAVSFFPHEDEEDYAVSYDVYAARELYAAPGRRSKKREAALLAALPAEAEALAASLEGSIFWNRPLQAAQYG